MESPGIGSGDKWKLGRPVDLIRIETFLESRRLTACAWSRLAVAFLVAMLALPFAASLAQAETRTLKLYFLHTGEKAEITFKRNGRYDPAGLQKINRFLRDWRRNEPTKMNPRLLDLIWTAYQQTGSNGYINVVCGYRSPSTNSMLRSRSKGVAKKSQHMLGNAMDFFIPGVPLKKLRDIGLKLQGGGVGYYPTSGSPFVHFDVGNVRHWPRMNRQELVSVFPNGRTLHVPSDGKPLPGFDQALADYEARRASGGTALALASAGPAKKSRSLLARLFGGGGGADDEEDSSLASGVAVAEAAPQPQPKAAKRQTQPVLTAAPAAEAEEAAPSQVASNETIVTALPPRSALLPEIAPRPKAIVGAAMAAEMPIAMNDAVADAPPPPEPAPVVVAAAEDGMKVPLPTRRPDYSPVAGEAEDSVLMALVDVKAPLPSGRPELEKIVASADDGVDRDARTTALSRAAVADASAAEDSEAIASLIRATEPRELEAEKVAANEPMQVVTSKAKSTEKSARATRKDRKQPAATVLPAQPSDARWAFDENYVAHGKPGNTPPSFAYNLVRTAPREVYANGFQPGGKELPTKKFIGTAVAFMPVARFETN